MGRVEVICGSMFSGKSEELIRLIRRALIAKQTIQVFKPSLDHRRGIDKVSSHNGESVEAQAVDDAKDILDYVKQDTTFIAIDEVQFFKEDVIETVQQLADSGRRVVVAGLDMDFRGEPFGCMPHLMAVADDVRKLHAICVECGGNASRTQRLVNGKPARYDDEIVLIGATEAYEARCREHHIVERD